jgi:methanogenic corrinoid protein MtbC1
MTESSNNNSPLYNMSAVLRETGLKPDVLRAWERRYGLPNPIRSSGGHRLYSRKDIDIVKWLQARQVEGMSIRRAVELWKELSEVGPDPTYEYNRLDFRADDFQPIDALPMEALRNKWLEACLMFNHRLADDSLNEALALYPVERICIDLLQPALFEVGKRWYHGTATVQQEHFVSAQVNRRMESLINATPDPTRDQTVMVGCPPGELHTYPSLFISLMLRRKGYKVIDLGADIPLDQMQMTIATIKPDLVVMSAQQLTTAASILTAAYLLQEWKVAFAYGGLVFNRIPSLRSQIPAYFLGENLAEALKSINSLLAGTLSYPRDLQVAGNRQAMITRFQESRPRIELALFDIMKKVGLSIGQISEVNNYLGDRIIAALTFGNPAFIEPDLEWLRGSLSIRKLPLNLLAVFLKSYSQSIKDNMDIAGESIMEWMDVLVTKINEQHQ